MSDPVVGVGVREFKRLFFRPEKITDPLERAKQQRFSRFGYFTMRDARESIRKPGKGRVKLGAQGRDKKGRFTRAKRLKAASSKPGSPPYNQTGLLKRFVYFGWDRAVRSVVIGPAAFKSGGKVTQAIEHGGEAVNNGVRLKYAARPFVRPAFDRQLAKQGPQLMRDAI